MVRLKVRFFKLFLYTNFISIPYGAIKRTLCSILCSILCTISIPYGAIKRITDCTTKKIDNLFQFLMVRLKEYTCTLANSILHISIPYGAIKRILPFIMP